MDFSFFKTYNSSRKPNNFTPEEFGPLLKLSKNKNVAYQKSFKGNSIVLIDKIMPNKLCPSGRKPRGPCKSFSQKSIKKLLIASLLFG